MQAKVQNLKQKVLAENEAAAATLRKRFQASGTLVLNLISSPGSGKTSLLCVTLKHLLQKYHCAVLVGDVATDRDATRLAESGAKAVQIATGGACHLDARMVEQHWAKSELGELDFLFIENVGNLICPTSFDLGEHCKVALLSVPEGDDKVLKYPALFRKAGLCLLGKQDLLESAGQNFSLKRVREDLNLLNPDGRCIELSSLSGYGMSGWYNWLEEQLQEVRACRMHAQEAL